MWLHIGLSRQSRGGRYRNEVECDRAGHLLPSSGLHTCAKAPAPAHTRAYMLTTPHHIYTQHEEGDLGRDRMSPSDLHMHPQTCVHTGTRERAHTQPCEPGVIILTWEEPKGHLLKTCSFSDPCFVVLRKCSQAGMVLADTGDAVAKKHPVRSQTSRAGRRPAHSSFAGLPPFSQ